MKKNLGLMFLLLLTMVVASYAQTAGDTNYALSELAVSPFQKIVVNSNVDVVLVQNDTLKKAYIEGDEKLVPEIAITVNNGTLTISSRENVSYRGKVQVTIAVKQLLNLAINADASVVAFDALQTPKLQVSINGICDLHLKSTGKILFDAETGYRLRYKNTQGNDKVVVVEETEG